MILQRIIFALLGVLALSCSLMFTAARAEALALVSLLVTVACFSVAVLAE